MEYLEHSRQTYSKKKSLSASFRVNLLIYVIAILVVLTFALLIRNVLPSDYKVEYIEYTMSKGDNITHAIESINQKYDGPYDMRDLIYMVVEKNNLDSHKVYPGKTYLIPKLLASH
ncbi:hypothetical protein [Virgibacillus salexigens]|uniref:Cell division suppressor protein YneA n=1 Tax=Virgibacillus massiliensis TaxID=1462526 RepID=A0A024QHZ8_9BACI|nr:hypothetical protein [Virgibacillus massiliensis]CDQ41867.1 cell division suppressor protein YneA [Virgibacillus massiliensis]